MAKISKNQTSYYLSYMQAQIDLLKKTNRLGTASNYERTKKSFSTFLNGKDISFRFFNVNLIDRYNSYLVQRNLSRNSISFYMRILRAVYRKAIKQKILVPRQNPFENVYLGVDKTRKRAVGEFVISKLYKMNLSYDSSLELARDVFIFSFLMRGMSFVDVAYLRKTAIQGGKIFYNRHKTGQLICVKIEPSIDRIINRYKDCNEHYIFPYIVSDDNYLSYEQYRLSINRYNKSLRKLSKMLNGDIHLTSYVARHSWASVARKQNIPISVISASLGHTTETTTQIYLSTIDNTIIDRANQLIIKRLGIR